MMEFIQEEAHRKEEAAKAAMEVSAVLCCAVLCCAVLCCAVEHQVYLMHTPYAPTPAPPTGSLAPLLPLFGTPTTTPHHPWTH